MGVLKNKLLDTIKNLSLYREYGFFYSNNAKVEVSIISNTEINVKVIDNNKEYVETLLLDNNGYIKTQCSCKKNSICDHIHATLVYIKENVDELDSDYCLTCLDNDLDFTILLFNNILEQCQYIQKLSENRQQKFIRLLSKLYGCIIINLENEYSQETTSLFYRIFHFFFHNEFTYLSENQQEELYNKFYFTINNPTKDILKGWRTALPSFDFQDLLPLILNAISLVDSHEKSRGICKFIDETIKALEKGEFRFSEINNSIKDFKIETIVKLILSKLDLLKKYDNDENYLEYIKKVSPYYVEIEAKYLFELYDKNDYVSIINYIKNTKTSFTPSNILYNVILYKSGNLIYKDFLKSVLNLFKDSCEFIDFEIIYKVLPTNEFNEIKDKLLKYAQKKNKYDFIEMEIFLNKEKGFDIAKQSGVIEFNKHVEHFISDKYDLIIPIYQEGLVEIFSKLKSLGKKYWEAMKALKYLENLKNGKYFIFTIYYMARENCDYNYNEVINSLEYYIQKLYL